MPKYLPEANRFPWKVLSAFMQELREKKIHGRITYSNLAIPGGRPFPEKLDVTDISQVSGSTTYRPGTDEVTRTVEALAIRFRKSVREIMFMLRIGLMLDGNNKKIYMPRDFKTLNDWDSLNRFDPKKKP